MSRIFASLAVVATASRPASGTYDHKKVTLTDDGLEERSGVSSRDYQIAYPSSGADGEKFPLIVYAHGAAGGGVDSLAYEKHLGELASYGFVVIFPKSCFMGCAKEVEFEAESPDFCYGKWPSFVYENARALDWAKNQTGEFASVIDWSAGAGVAGHSMGGEVVSQLASQEFAEKYNIKAAVCEHCLMCIKTGDLVSTPAMYMTGTLDYEVAPKKVKKAFNLDTVAPKSYRNQKGKGHLEMLNLEVQYNPAVASHAAAFFNVWLKGDKDVYYNQVYGTGDDSFCGYDGMKECEHVMSPAPPSPSPPAPSPPAPSPPAPSPVPTPSPTPPAPSPTPAGSHFGKPPCQEDEKELHENGMVSCAPKCERIFASALKACPTDRPSEHMPQAVCDENDAAGILGGKCRLECTDERDCDVANGGVCHQISDFIGKRRVCGYPDDAAQVV